MAMWMRNKASLVVMLWHEEAPADVAGGIFLLSRCCSDRGWSVFAGGFGAGCAGAGLVNDGFLAGVGDDERLDGEGGHTHPRYAARKPAPGGMALSLNSVSDRPVR